MNDKIAALEADLDIALGRINALHAFCLVMAEAMPQETLARAAAAMKTGGEKVHADALASPVPDRLLNEMQRVMAELQQSLESNSRAPR